MSSYNITLWFNSVPDLISDFFKIFDLVGRESFYLFVFPLIFWCINKSLGKRLIIITSISSFLGYFFKDIFTFPRPYNISLSGKAQIMNKLGDLGLYSFPSNHVLTVTSYWGFLSLNAKLKLSKLVCYSVIILSGISRLVHGVQFIHYVIISMCMAIIILVLFVRFESKVADLYNTQYSVIQRLLIVVIVSAGTIILAVIFNSNTSLVPIALFLGSVSGIILEKEYLGFEVEGTLEIRLIRYISGVIILSFIYFLMNYLIFISGENIMLIFLKYMLLGFTGTYIIPMVFIKINLANRAK